jgi:hypothetical protein
MEKSARAGVPPNPGSVAATTWTGAATRASMIGSKKTAVHMPPGNSSTVDLASDGPDSRMSQSWPDRRRVGGLDCMTSSYGGLHVAAWGVRLIFRAHAAQPAAPPARSPGRPWLRNLATQRSCAQPAATDSPPPSALAFSTNGRVRPGTASCRAADLRRRSRRTRGRQSSHERHSQASLLVLFESIPISCAVELRGFEPQTSCMPFRARASSRVRDLRWHNARCPRQPGVALLRWCQFRVSGFAPPLAGLPRGLHRDIIKPAILMG